MKSRYQESPMFILLENLVLHAIGALDEADYVRLRAIEPRLQQTFGQSLTWNEIVKTQLDLPSEFEDQVRSTWKRACADAKKQDMQPDAVQFAQAIADRVLGPV